MFAQCGHAERRLFRAQGHFPAYRCRACEGDPQANPPDVRLSPLRALKLHMSQPFKSVDMIRGYTNRPYKRRSLRGAT
jgi:hypothetical protein